MATKIHTPSTLKSLTDKELVAYVHKTDGQLLRIAKKIRQARAASCPSYELDALYLEEGKIQHARLNAMAEYNGRLQ